MPARCRWSGGAQLRRMKSTAKVVSILCILAVGVRAQVVTTGIFQDAQTTVVSAKSGSTYTYTQGNMGDPSGGTNTASFGLGVAGSSITALSYTTTAASGAALTFGSVAGGQLATKPSLAGGADFTFAIGDLTSAGGGTAVAFRVDGYSTTAAAKTYYVGVDLTANDTASNFATNVAGKATIDFFLGVAIDATNKGQVFVYGAQQGGSSATTQGYNTAANAISFQTSGTPKVNIGTSAVTGGAYFNISGTTLSFAADFTSINSALTTIYGGTGVQWVEGTQVRFVPIGVNGTPGTALASNNNDFMGSTTNSGVTTPFATNATGAITDVYSTGSSFVLTYTHSTEVQPVPEPSTVVSSAVLLLTGAGLVWWRRRKAGVDQSA